MNYSCLKFENLVVFEILKYHKIFGKLESFVKFKNNQVSEKTSVEFEICKKSKNSRKSGKSGTFTTDLKNIPKKFEN